MKILYINNYSCNSKHLAEVEDYTFLSNHLWGVYELYKRGHQIDFLNSRDFPSVEGKKNFITRLLNSFRTKKYYREVLDQYKNHDVIYSPISGSKQMDFFAKLKKKKKIKAKLIATLHHPENRLKHISAYNKILFLSKIVMSHFSMSNQEYLFWGPDMPFFNDNMNGARSKNKSNRLTFISNGKTFRDHNLFLSAAYRAKALTITICNSDSAPDERYCLNKDHQIFCIDNNSKRISAVENTKMVHESDVMVIPVRKDNVHLCGLTSFIDGIG